MSRERAVQPTRRAALGLAMTGLLAGCGLRADRGIRPGLDVNPQVSTARPDTLPQDWTNFDGAEETVRGFLMAGAATGANLSIAKGFLTPELANYWDPDSRATLVVGPSSADDDRSMTFRDDDSGEVRVRIPVAAKIVQGRYEIDPPYGFAEPTFGLSRDGERWVIADLPVDFGRALSNGDVAGIFTPIAVYYLARGWDAYVPDVRWVPGVTDQTATALARALLGQVPDYLGEGVEDYADVDLRVDAVPVSGGVAQVDLAAGSLPNADATKRRRVAAQLARTLLQVPGVDAMRILLDGSEMDIEGVEQPIRNASDLGFATSTRRDLSAVVRVDDHLHPVPVGDLDTVDAEGLRGSDSPFAELPSTWRRVALSPDGTEVAAVSDQGRELARYQAGVDQALPVDSFARSLTRPAYDYAGALWVAGIGLGTEAGHSIWAINSAADVTVPGVSGPVALPTPWVKDDEHIRSFAISSEGSRVAVVTVPRQGGSATLRVAGVGRASNGLPISIAGSPWVVAQRLVEIRDLAWVDDTRLAVIARRDAEDFRPMLVEVGGEIEDLEPRPGIVDVIGVGSARNVIVSDRRSRCWQRAGRAWLRLEGIDNVVVSGA